MHIAYVQYYYHSHKSLPLVPDVQLNISHLHVSHAYCIIHHHILWHFIRYCPIYSSPLKLSRHVGSGDIAPLIFNLGSRWKYVVSLIPRPTYPQVKSCGAHRQGNLVSPRAGVGNEEKVLPPLENEPQVSIRLPHSLVTVQSELLYFIL